jgi:hypothetical protein
MIRSLLTSTFGSSRLPGSLGSLGSDVGLSGLDHDGPGLDGSEIHSKPAFPNIARSDLMNTLRERIESPIAIDQKNTDLCGPASLMFLLASYKPNVYRQYVMELYEKGTAMLGSLRVTPGESCKNYNPNGKMDAADWVALAGLRDSENLFLDFDSVEASIAGRTAPFMIENWLHAAGFTDIVDETNLYLTKGADDFRKAARLLEQGYHVIMFVKGAGIDRNAENRSWLKQLVSFPNHWVVLTDVISLKDESVEFTVFSWGRPDKDVRQHSGKRLVPQDSTPMTMDHWLQYFYGYIACKG